jgi:hypothetical protein
LGECPYLRDDRPSRRHPDGNRLLASSADPCVEACEKGRGGAHDLGERDAKRRVRRQLAEALATERKFVNDHHATKAVEVAYVVGREPVDPAHARPA